MPSTVSTRRLSASRPSTRQERIERPSTRIAQVPHSPSSQPCLVPVRFRSSRRTSSSVLCGAKATSVCSPLSLKRICFLLWPCTVFLLHLIQNRIVYETRFADVCGDRDKSRPIVELINLVQCLCVGNGNIIQTRAWFRLNSRSNHIDNPVRVPLAFLESMLCLDQRLMNHGRRVL